MKARILVIALLLVPCMLFASFMPGFGASGYWYGSFPKEPYLQSRVPFRSQASIQVRLEPLYFELQFISLRFGGQADLVLDSPTLDSYCMQGFKSLGMYTGLGYSHKDFSISLIACFRDCYFLHQGDVRFSSLLLSLEPSFLVSSGSWVKIYAICPVSIDIRRDLIGMCISAGISLRYDTKLVLSREYAI
ncbi:MAG: hypothetical protein WCR70_07235 [Sphaerochaetaceae bacterium]